MRGAFTGLVTAFVLVSACSSEGHSLTIDLRTDYLPGTEFTQVETTVEIGATSRDAIPSGASAMDDFVVGERIAEYDGLPTGDAQIRVSIRNPAGELLATRLTRLRLDGDRGMLVVVSRSCGGVMCPGPTDDPDATECLSGVCVPPSCMADSAGTCGGVACEVGTSCASSIACVEPICDGPACLLAARDERCAAAERCDPSVGCVPATTDAGVDGSMTDGGVDPSLVAYWPCDARDGLTLEDATGNGHDGTCTTALCPGIVAGRVGMACDFISEFPDSIVVPHHPDFDAEGGFTIALWMLARAFNGVSAFAKPLGAGPENSYKIGLFDTGSPSLEFTTSTSTMAANDLRTSTTLVDEWHHVAATWDGTTKRLYLDGVEVGTASADVGFDASGICIGCDEDAGVRTDYFEGLLDEIRFYRRVLTLGEIEALATVP